MSKSSTFLFADPSFAGGFASIIDMGDTLTEYNRRTSGAMADFVALNADWQAIGEDMTKAINQIAKDNDLVRKIPKKKIR